MATIYTRASKGSALTWAEGDANVTNLNNAKLENVAEDLTPQLGGNLDVNGNSIVSASNGNIAITPNGTGSVVLDGLNWPQADGSANYVLKTNGSGQLSWTAQTADTNTTYSVSAETATGGVNLRLTGSDATTDDVKLAEGSNITLTRTDANTITIAATDTTGSFTVAGDSGSSQTIDNGNTLTISGGTGLSSVASATDTITINLDNTAVTPASYTYASITVDAQGRITSASNGTTPLVSGGALGTPSSGTLTNATGLPIGTGVSGLGSGVATFLATPSSANLAAALTDETGSGANVFATSPTLVTPILGTPTSGNLTNCTVDGTNPIGYRDLPAVGSQSGSYSLTTGDVGKYVEVASGGSITVPNSTFAAGDVVVIVNNHTAAITITCSITDAYIAGTDTDKATVSLATRGIANIFFVSGTRCIITGNVS